MRIDTLSAENYGVFHERTWNFAPGFQVIHGPNEAGKSTLLQLVREVLFGFPVRNHRYAFPDHHGALAARAELTLADDRQLRYRRRKGGRTPVHGEIHPGNTPLDAEGLKRLLGGASQELYERIFGFALPDLTEGEKALQHVDLRDALYGASLGGLARYRALQEQLAKSTGELYLERGRTGPKINGLLKTIRDAETSVREAALRPAEYRDLVEQRSAEQAQARKLQTRLDSLKKKIRLLERLQEAYPLQEQLTRELSEQSGIHIPEGFPTNGMDEYRRLQQQAKDLNDDLRQVAEQADEVQASLDEIEVNKDLVQAAAQIRRLHQQTTQIESMEQTYPETQAQIDQLNRETQDLTGKLEDAGIDSHRQCLAGSILHLDALADMESRHSDLSKQLTGVEAQLPRLQSELREAVNGLTAMGTVVDPAQLESVVRKHPKHAQLQQRCENLAQQVQQANDAYMQIDRRLRTLCETPPTPLERLAVSTASHVREHAERGRQFEQDADALARQKQEAEAELLQRQSQQDREKQADTVPDRGELKQVREARDAAWQVVKQRYVDQTITDSAVSTWLKNHRSPSLTEALESLLQRADQIADERQASAEEVAHHETLQADIAAQQDRIRAVELEADRLAERKAEWIRAWNAEWETIGITPRCPVDMEEWQTLHQQLVERREDADASQKLLDTVNREREALEQEIRRVVRIPQTESTELPIEQLFHIAQDQLNAVRSRQHDHDQLCKQREERQRQLEHLTHQQVDLRAQLESWKQQWSTHLKQWGIPTDWSISSVRQAISLFNTLDGKLSRREQLLDQAEKNEASRKTFQHELQQLMPLAAYPTDQPGTDTVRQLHGQLETEQQKAQNRQNAEKQKARLLGLTTSKKKKLEHCNKRLQELITLAQASDQKSFEEVAQQAARYHDLAISIKTLYRQIDIAAGDYDRKDFRDRLAEAEDPETLQRQLDQANIDWQQCDHDVQQALERKAICQDRIQQWTGESKALSQTTECETLRSRLRDAVDEWAPQILAQALMREAVERFEREHQPALLADVESIFQKITRGRYTRVQRQLDDSATLLVVTGDGQRRSPEQLSTGTREQLYLSVRLAFVRQYCNQSEPLPLIMDDVLVNFDDDRCSDTLKVLAEFGTDHQILFLTCHQSAVAHARSCLPDVLVHELGVLANEVTTANH